MVFANLAEALAEGRGKAQADALRAMRTDTTRALQRRGEEPAAASCSPATWWSSRRAS